MLIVFYAGIPGVPRGKQILAGLGTVVIINPNGTAEIRGDLGKALRFVGPMRKPNSSLWWMGELDSCHFDPLLVRIPLAM